MDEYEQKYMEPNERVLFREKVVSRSAFAVAIVFLAVFGAVGLALVAAAIFGVLPLAVGLGAGAPLVLLGVTMAVLGAMFSVYRSMVTTSHLHSHFGWTKRRVAHSAIEAVRVVTLEGFRQGKVSIGLDGIVRTWVGQSASGRGVEVTYREPGARTHVVTIGSEHTDDYAAELERARTGGGRECPLAAERSAANPSYRPERNDRRRGPTSTSSTELAHGTRRKNEPSTTVRRGARSGALNWLSAIASADNLRASGSRRRSYPKILPYWPFGARRSDGGKGRRASLLACRKRG